MCRGVLAFVVVAGCGRCGFEAPPVIGEAPRLSAHGMQSCIVRDDDSLWCWGKNSYGQLGVGDTIAHDPVQVAGEWDGVWTGEHSTCARAIDGELWCWGRNDVGQATTAAGPDALLPVRLPLPAGIASVGIGESHACAVSNGTVHCWGLDACGQVTAGSGSPTATAPTAITGLPPIKLVTAHDTETCALDTSDRVWCWGSWDAVIGSGSYTSCGVPHGGPTELSLPAPALSVHGGCHGHACAVLDDGGMYCWGHNLFGELGDNTMITASSPRQTQLFGSGLPARRVVVGAHTTCAVVDNGLYCWGQNSRANYGDGTTTASLVPRRNAFFDGRSVGEIDIGCFHGCAIIDEQLYCWGDNANRAVGDGTTTTRLSPVAVQLP